MRATRLLGMALFGGATVILLSCGEPGPVGTTSSVRPSSDLIGPIVVIDELLHCTPLPYDSVTQPIGPEGGTIHVGGHALSIPAGALDTLVTITAVSPSDTVNHVQLRPEGLTFQQSASLTMSYANCNVLGLPVPKRIAYTTDVLNILYFLQSVDDPISRSVTGRLDHFSDYAVAW